MDDEKAYLIRLSEASRHGDLDELADLIVKGAKGSRILPDTEVDMFAKGIRKGEERHSTHKHWMIVALGALVIAVVVAVS